MHRCRRRRPTAAAAAAAAAAPAGAAAAVGRSLQSHSGEHCEAIPEPALLGCCCSTAEAVPAMAVIEAVPVTQAAVPVPQPADQAAVPVTQVCKSWQCRQLPEDLQLGRLSYHFIAR